MYLSNAYLSDTYLSNAHLNVTYVNDVNFSGTYLSDTYHSDTYFNDTYLRGMCLRFLVSVTHLLRIWDTCILRINILVTHILRIHISVTGILRIDISAYLKIEPLKPNSLLRITSVRWNMRDWTLVRPNICVTWLHGFQNEVCQFSSFELAKFWLKMLNWRSTIFTGENTKVVWTEFSILS
jgi:uncharacterized protein YjbI with pentapeptide repeats